MYAGEYLEFKKIIYKKTTQNYYLLYCRSKNNAKKCPRFAICATDPGTVRINASAYYPSFTGTARKLGLAII